MQAGATLLAAAILAAAILAAAILAGVAGCSAPVPASPRATAMAAGAHLDRPCSVLTPEVAAAVAGAPYLRTLSADLVESDTVVCIQALGPGGVQGIARLVVHIPALSGPAEVRFVALCRGEAPSRLEQPGPSWPRASRGDGRPNEPVQKAGLCMLPNGGMAVRLSDRVVEVTVEGADGMMQLGPTRLLAETVLERGRRAAGGAIPSVTG